MKNTVLVLFLVTVTELPKLDWQLEKQAGEMIKTPLSFFNYVLSFCRSIGMNQHDEPISWYRYIPDKRKSLYHFWSLIYMTYKKVYILKTLSLAFV